MAPAFRLYGKVGSCSRNFVRFLELRPVVYTINRKPMRGRFVGITNRIVMSEQIHGHEVMKMMLESGGSYSRETLRNAIIDQFGEETRYFTCSQENMTADELIEFLAVRGKFVEAGVGFNTDPDRICSH